ncbi:AP2/ERF and B3 domain-containing transcription factor At1g51120-like [Salvia splendens]|uniref:AP2/ERF and B3 domain-containing transcription factor At1g51120-like n=1 Tax=Salvia splendens TaxID=180675 RepID=UPI001101A466|nr:AP2/ERF and B3 domain-containing transcription factor At1g51120-like [Salvia splendens]
MEEISMISHTKLGEESSESANFPGSRPRSTERFKGVVPQQTGHWGAQIYANHQRIWLGTFKSEASAAMAYDSAAMKLRSGDSHRNFPPTILAPLELKFQSGLSTDSMLNMIRDGSYSTKFSEFLASPEGDEKLGLGLGFQLGLGLGFDSSIDGDGEFSSMLLFQKELTPSDVGKLNRLVIPKRYAVKYFPGVPEEEQVQLEFYDRAMRVWKFRYCYWKSSQSYVFTRGWSRFVKAKGLRSNDSVAFYLYESRKAGRRLGRRFIVIDVAEKEGGFGEVVEDEEEEAECFKESLVCSSPSSSVTKVGFRLFGTQINTYV